MEQGKTERRRTVRYVALWVAAVALLTFVLYQALGLGRVTVQTVTAVRSLEYNVAQLDGYIFRDEHVLYSENSGAAVYCVADGARVSADTELCRVYKTGSTAGYLAERRRLEARLELISKAIELGQMNAGGIERTQEALDASYADVMSALGAGSLDAATDKRDQLLIALGARELLRGGSLDDEYSAVSEELRRLDSSYSGTYESIKNTSASYFFYSCDGYERLFDIDLLDTVDAKTLRTMAAAEPDFDGNSNPVGKLVDSYQWHLVLAAEEDVISKVKLGNEYTLTLDGRELNMTLRRADSQAGVLVFDCGIMPQGFDYTRTQTVKLIIGKVSGYRVPLEALHTREGLDGVYVLSGSEVIFRRVTVLYRGDGYAVVAERDYSTENYREFLNLNDSVIVSVSDAELYDGRILD